MFPGEVSREHADYKRITVKVACKDNRVMPLLLGV